MKNSQTTVSFQGGMFPLVSLFVSMIAQNILKRFCPNMLEGLAQELEQLISFWKQWRSRKSLNSSLLLQEWDKALILLSHPQLIPEQNYLAFCYKGGKLPRLGSFYIDWCKLQVQTKCLIQVTQGLFEKRQLPRQPCE